MLDGGELAIIFAYMQSINTPERLQVRPFAAGILLFE